MDAHGRNVLLAAIGIQVADANFGLDETYILASLPFQESETDGRSGVMGNENERRRLLRDSDFIFWSFVNT